MSLASRFLSFVNYSHVWRYRLDRDYSLTHPILNNRDYFNNEFITIENGTLTVRAGYAWDGCTPSFYLLWGLVCIGTPDGAIRYGYPWLYFVSLIHDVLCQYRKDLPFTKQEVTTIFYDMMAQCNWPLKGLYRFAVYYFGSDRDFKQS